MPPTRRLQDCIHPPEPSSDSRSHEGLSTTATRRDGPSYRVLAVAIAAVNLLGWVGPGCSTGGNGSSTNTPTPDESTRPPSSARNAESGLTRQQPLMGTTFRIEVESGDRKTATEAIGAAFDEVARVEDRISGWESSSELSRVNRAAGDHPVSVGPALMELVQTSQRISRKTDGAFDITFASCHSLWSFRQPRVPSDGALDECRSTIGYEQIRIRPSASVLFLPNSDLRIGVGGVGKGYGVDRAAEVLRERGVDDYLVDGGGDVRVASEHRESPWRIGVAHPRRKGRLLGQLAVRRGAVVTSGDYERYFERDGTRYHHILNPKTARPARKAVAVTVWADRAAVADALSTGLFVLGPERGLELARSLPDVEALIVDPDLELHATKGFDRRFRTARRGEP